MESRAGPGPGRRCLWFRALQGDIRMGSRSGMSEVCFGDSEEARQDEKRVEGLSGGPASNWRLHPHLAGRKSPRTLLSGHLPSHLLFPATQQSLGKLPWEVTAKSMTGLLRTQPRCSRAKTRSGICHRSPHAPARLRSRSCNSLLRRLGNGVRDWAGKRSSPLRGHLSSLYLTDCHVVTKPN